MGKRGPKPLPSHIRTLNGNPSHRPYNEREPKPEVGEPETPKFLNRRAKAVWRKLVEQLLGLGVLSPADGIALEMLCTDIAELEKVFAQLTRTGYLVVDPNSRRIRQNPLVGLVAELNKRVMIGLREFGLTPSARSRVEMIVDSSHHSEKAESKMAAFLRQSKPA